LTGDDVEFLGSPVAVDQPAADDGPQRLLGRTLSVLGDGSAYDGTLGDRTEDRVVATQVRALLRAGRTARLEIGGDTGTCPEKLTLLVHTRAPRPRMLIFGAVDFAAALSQAGRFLGYHVTVCDALPRLRHTRAFPPRRRGRRRLAPPLPGAHGSRRPYRDLRPHPLSLLLARPITGPTTTIRLPDLDTRLRTSAVGRGLASTLEELGPSLTNRRAVRDAAAAERARVWSAAQTEVEVTSLSAQPWTAQWLEEIRRGGTLAR
jgi:xanthine/CO dehydrogenase XdhC/CoxF family maturation factor